MVPGGGPGDSLTLCCSVVYSTRRFFLLYVNLFLCVFTPFSIAITSFGWERVNLSAFRTIVWFVLVWFCQFPLPLDVWGGERFVIMALPGLFSYLFVSPDRGGAGTIIIIKKKHLHIHPCVCAIVMCRSQMLRPQLLLQISSDCFDSLQVFLLWCEYLQLILDFSVGSAR